MRDVMVDGFYPGSDFIDTFKGGNVDSPISVGANAGIYFERSTFTVNEYGNIDNYLDIMDSVLDHLDITGDTRVEFVKQVETAINIINENRCLEECGNE